jgi:hypothetical protein
MAVKNDFNGVTPARKKLDFLVGCENAGPKKN